jgi:hypothetical protein
MRKTVSASVALLALCGTALAGDLVRVKYTGIDSTSYLVYIYRTGASTVHAYASQMNVTLDGSPYKAFCVDLDHTISTDFTYNAELVPVTGAPWCEIGYVLTNYSATTALLGAQIQTALWKLTYPDSNLWVDNAAVENGANAIVAEADGTCPLSCETAPVVDIEILDEADGLLYGTATVTLGGAPVVGQWVEFTPSFGAVLEPAGARDLTDDFGQVDFVVDPGEAADGIEVTATMDGRTLYAIVPLTETPQQLLTFTYETCAWTDADSFSATPLGDMRTIGFWKHNFGVASGAARGAWQVEPATLSSWLPFTVFGNSFTTLSSVYSVLNLAKATTQQRALQQCTATYLNVLYGQVGWQTEVPGYGVFWETWADIEEAYAAGRYSFAQSTCDALNNL